MTVTFHAGGLDALKKTGLAKERKAERRKRVERVLAERAEELASAGYWEKRAILESIQKQVDREESFEHCLF